MLAITRSQGVGTVFGEHLSFRAFGCLLVGEPDVARFRRWRRLEPALHLLSRPGRLLDKRSCFTREASFSLTDVTNATVSAPLGHHLELDGKPGVS